MQLRPQPRIPKQSGVSEPDVQTTTYHPNSPHDRGKAVERIVHNFDYFLSRAMVAIGLDKSHNVCELSSHKIRRSDKIIVLMGPTGVGKSNFIQSLTRKDLDIAKATLSRGTHNVKAYRVLNHPIWNDRIVLVDTPGFIDEFLSEYAVLKEIREWIKKSKVTHIDRLFYFDNINSPLTRGRVDCFGLFHAVCGLDAAHKTCLITTNWDFAAHQTPTEQETWKKRAQEKLQKMSDEYWKEFCKAGTVVVKFENVRSAAEDTLTQSLGSEFVEPIFAVEGSKHLARTLMGEKAYRFLQDRQANLIQESIMMDKVAQISDPKKEKRAQALRIIADNIKEYISFRILDSYNVEPLVEVRVRPADQVIMLLGSIGSGKSNFIQSLTRVNLHIAKDPNTSTPGRHTNAVQAYRLLNHPVWKDHIILVDTPGLMDPLKSDYGVLKDLRQWMKDNDLQRIHGVLCFHSITSSLSLDSVEVRCLDLLRAICGGKAASRSGLITTRWDMVATSGDKNADHTMDEAQQKLKKLSSEPEYWKNFLTKETRILEFENTPDSAQQSLTTLLNCLSGDASFVLEDSMTSHLQTTALGKTLYAHLQTQHDSLQCDPSYDTRLHLRKIQEEMREFNTCQTAPANGTKRLSDDLGAPMDPPTEGITAPEFPIINNEAWNLLLDQPTTTSCVTSAEELSKDDILILMMGLLGAGKTTFIKLVSTHMDTHDGGKPGEIHCIKIPFPGRKNNLVLADMPSFSDPRKSDEDVSREISTWLALLHRRGIPVSGAVYLYDITQERFDAETAEALKYFNGIVGEKFLDRTVLCSTGWNKIQDEKRSLFQDKEKEAFEGHFKPSLNPTGSFLKIRHQFDPTKPVEARKLAIDAIFHLVGDKKPVSLLVQEELVVDGRDYSDTTIGKLMQTLDRPIFRVAQDEGSTTIPDIRIDMVAPLASDSGDLCTPSTPVSRPQHRRTLSQASNLSYTSPHSPLTQSAQWIYERTRRVSQKLGPRRMSQAGD